VTKRLSKIIHTIQPSKHQDIDELDVSNRSQSSSGKRVKQRSFTSRLFIKSQSSNDLCCLDGRDPLQSSMGKHRKQHDIDCDDRVEHDASMRKTFTTYHNSRDFGKDTTSAYLATSEEDSSSHHHEQQFYNFYYKLSSYHPPTKSNYYSPSSLLFASSEPLDTLVEGRGYINDDSPDCIADMPHDNILDYEDNIPLFSLNGFEEWKKHSKDISEKLILPAVLRMCPVSVVTVLLSDKKDITPSIKTSSKRSGLAQMLEPLSDDETDCKAPSEESASSFSLHKTKLGNAKVTILNKNHINDNYYLKNNFQSTFYIAMNYLYEYKNPSSKNLLPRSITHLHNAMIRKHDTFANVFEMIIRQNRVMKHLVITLGSVKERDEWVEKLSRACGLDIPDVYDFNMEQVLGTGRYATVVPATHKNDVKRRAIKIIDKTAFFERVSRSKERIDTLVREVAIQTTLSIQEHTNNFLQLKNVFETSTKLVLELELLNGLDLFSYVTTHGVLDESKASWIIRDLLLCCSGMKRRGIAHRDIKPANILVTDDLLNEDKDAVAVKLGDYGMSTFCGIDDLCHGRCGTPGYVAPEILKAGVNSRYRNSVDVFSVGVTLYVLLCGYEPFYGENDAELIQVNKEGYFDFPDDDWSTVSDEAKDLITQLMEKDPLKRITADKALLHPWVIKYAPIKNISTNQNNCTIC